MPWKVPAQVEGIGDGAGRGAHHLAGDAFDAARHFSRRRGARKVIKQDAARVGAVDDEVGDAVGEGVGLARAGAGDDQQRAADGIGVDAMLYGAALLGIQALEVVDLGGHGRIKRVRMRLQSASFSFCSQELVKGGRRVVG